MNKQAHAGGACWGCMPERMPGTRMPGTHMGPSIQQLGVAVGGPHSALDPTTRCDAWGHSFNSRFNNAMWVEGAHSTLNSTRLVAVGSTHSTHSTRNFFSSCVDISPHRICTWCFYVLYCNESGTRPAPSAWRRWKRQQRHARTTTAQSRP